MTVSDITLNILLGCFVAVGEKQHPISSERWKRKEIWRDPYSIVLYNLHKWTNNILAWNTYIYIDLYLRCLPYILKYTFIIDTFDNQVILIWPDAMLQV